MIGILLALAAVAFVGLAVVLGWTRDTRQPGRDWYPAGPDRRG